MDEFARSYFALAFENEFRKLKAMAFQDFFSDIMERRHPDDFIRVRPWGNQGDRKNDGYLRSSRQLFQVYAPNEIEESKTLKKISTDFNEALPHWEPYFDFWVFVHNCSDGLSPGILKLLLDLEEAQGNVRCTNWGLPELRGKVLELALSDLVALFGAAPSAEKNLRFEDIRNVLIGLSNSVPDLDEDLRPVPPQKMQFNDLSNDVRILLQTGSRAAHRVEQFFAEWPDPELGDRVAALFRTQYTEKRHAGAAPDAIFNELWEFARGGQARNSKEEFAVLALLAHLFELCDIFERPSENLAS
ncbi:MAG: hypothetical protein KF883_01220 [Thermomicrobiales bacterium]|nr:hypothetical protein [Thermomicrobiales bacterium]